MKDVVALYLYGIYTFAGGYLRGLSTTHAPLVLTSFLQARWPWVPPPDGKAVPASTTIIWDWLPIRLPEFAARAVRSWLAQVSAHPKQGGRHVHNPLPPDDYLNP